MFQPAVPHGSVSFAPATTTTLTTTDHSLAVTDSGKTHITIVAHFDSSVTNAGGTITADYEAAVNKAIAFWENEIANPITLNIDFGWGENGGTPIPAASGATSSVTSGSVDWTSLYNAVQATDTTSTVQTTAAALLSATDPTGGNGTFFISPAEQIALGLTSDSSAIVGTIGMSVDTYNWSETGTQNPNGSDAVSDFEHEISEVMGRTDDGGAGNDYTLLDLFRYTAADGGSADPIGSAAGTIDQPFVAGYSANANSYFSYNGSTVTLQYDTPAEVTRDGADIADWASNTHDSFNGEGPPGEIDPVSATDLQEMNVLGYDLVPQCFLAGTRIATAAGAVAVECLQPGNLVRTDDGEVLPVRFVGVQTIVSRFADPLALPIRIRAGALGDCLPSRDLVVSPGHALLVDGVLAQAGALVNGIGIVREATVPARFGYWHVELDRHALLIAEGCAAESYLRTAEAVRFDNAADRPNLPPGEEMPYPRIKSARQLPHAIAARLAGHRATVVALAAAA